MNSGEKKKEEEMNGGISVDRVLVQGCCAPAEGQNLTPRLSRCLWIDTTRLVSVGPCNAIVTLCNLIKNDRQSENVERRFENERNWEMMR